MSIHIKKPKAAHIFGRDPLDFYVEPEWVDDALFAAEDFDGPIHDTACGIGRVVESAIRAGHIASGSDVVELSPIRDFEFDYLSDNTPLSYPNIVSNPPYTHARGFIARALREARKSAFLVPYGFLFGLERFRWLDSTPLRRVWAIAPRPSMPPGELTLQGMKPGGGRVDYVWVVFESDYNGPVEMGRLSRTAR
jgi:hypothetical protein